MTPALGRTIDRVKRSLHLTSDDPRTPLTYSVPATFGVVMLAASVAFAGVVTPSAPPKPAPVVAPADTVTPAAGKPALKQEQAKPKPAAARPQRPETEMLGFYVNWDETSYTSLAENIDVLTVVSPEWLHLGNDARLHWDDYAAQKRAVALVKAKRPDLKITPIVNNYDKRTGRWNPDEVAVMLRDPVLRERIASDIVRTVKDSGFHGVNIDFEALPASSRADLTAFMRTLYAKAHPLGLTVSEDVALGSAAFDLKALAGATDYLVPMMYDEHYKGSGPGPVASQAWFEKDLKRMTKLVPASKIVVAMGTYGIDWPRSGKGTAVTFPKAMERARAARTPLVLDGRSLNPVIRYPGHEAWLLDAASLYNQVSASHRFGVRGYAIWKLGGEDPGVWKVLRNRDKLDASVAKSLNGPGRTVGYDSGRDLITAERLTP